MEKWAMVDLHIIGYMYQSWAARKFCWSRTGLGTLVKTPNWHLSSSLLYCFVPELQFISNGYSFVQPVTVLLLITSHSNISNSPTTIFLWMKWTRKKSQWIRLIITSKQDSPPSQGQTAMLNVMSYMLAERSRDISTTKPNRKVQLIHIWAKSTDF